MSDIMTVYVMQLANGKISFVEQDGDVGFNELENGKWTLRVSGEQDREFNNYTNLILHLFDYFKISEINICK